MWSRRSTAFRPARQAPAAQWEPGPRPSLARTPTGTSLRATRPPHRPRWAGRGSSWSWPLTDAVEAGLGQCSLWCPRGSPTVSSGSWRVPGAAPWARGLWSPSISSPVHASNGLVKARFRASGAGSVLCAPSPTPCRLPPVSPHQGLLQAPPCPAQVSPHPRLFPGAPAWPPFSPVLPQSCPLPPHPRSHTCGLHPGLA